MAIVALLMALFHSVTASAADTWSVNPGDYRYDMSLYLNVSFANGEKLDYTQYDVAVFVGDECRGVAEVLPLPGGADCLYLRARSNSERGETMTFRYRNKSTGEVKVVEKVDFAFSSNGSLGMPSSPYEVKIVFYHDVTITAGEGGTVNEKGGRLAEGSTLSLSATPAEGHHFVQWSDGSTDNPRHLIVGTEDITLTAEFALSSYRLTYTLDGVSFKETDVLYGTALTAEPNPEKEGYTFSGWQGLPETMPAHDVEVTGTFSINSYRLTVYLDDKLYKDETLEYGAPIDLPDPEVAEGRVFSGWDITVPETMPAHDVEIHGTTTIIDGLEAIFANGDTRVTIYSINGVLLFHNTTVKEAAQHLKSGIYIVNGRKMVVK